MANGHRTQIKRDRNAQKDTRPSAKLSFARIPIQKACFVMDAIRGKDVATAEGILTYNNRHASAVILKLLKSAVANAENDKKERERVDKLNQADSMIFQTETFLNENGDKLGSDRANVEAAVQQLKDAHKNQDIAAIDSAMANLNTVMQAASQKMYSQAGGQQAGPSAGFNGGQQASGQQQSGNSDETIQDADFEEVH